MSDYKANEFKRAQARARDAVNGVNMGPINALPLDRFGRPIQIGAMVAYHSPVDLVFQVANTRPILDPQARPGLVEVTLSVQFPVNVMARQPFIQMIVVVPAQRLDAHESDAQNDPDGGDGPSDPPTDPSGDLPPNSH